MKTHTHKCHCCGDEFTCKGVGKGPVCAVDKAVKVNGRGPYCMVCYHGMMFRRCCEVRRVELIGRLREITDHEHQMLFHQVVDESLLIV